MTIKKQKEEFHVVLGATGALGSAIVRKLAEDNKKVRAVVRNTIHAKTLFKNYNVEIFQANALEIEQLKRAINGATIVYHCIGLPYSKWIKIFPKIQKNIIEVVSYTEAKLVYADNLYMFGKMNGEMISEDHPHTSISAKGLLRSRLADELLQKHREGSIKVLIARFGDFYGPNVVNGFTLPLFKNPLNDKASSWIGDLDKKHSLIYIDDAASSLISLAEKADTYGQVWHVEGAEPVTGREFITKIFKELDKEPKMKVLTKRTITILGIIVPIVKELRELLDQWEYPFVIDGLKFKQAFPEFTPTPHKLAISTTLDWFTQNIF